MNEWMNDESSWEAQSINLSLLTTPYAFRSIDGISWLVKKVEKVEIWRGQYDGAYVMVELENLLRRTRHYDGINDPWSIPSPPVG